MTIRKDTVTEWEFGKGAIRTTGRFLMSEAAGSSREGGPRMTLVAGLVTDPLLSKPDRKTESITSKTMEESCEMWEGEVIFIPRRKYIENVEKGFFALKIDQKLLGLWGHAKYWKKKIFDKEEK